MSNIDNFDKLTSFANDAIKRTGLFITGLENGSYSVGISFNEETRYEIVLPYLVDDIAINEVFQNKEIKHGDIVESKLYSVSVTPDTYNSERRPIRYQIFDCEDPEVIAFLTENFALGWSGNRFPLVKVEKVRFLICEDSNYQLPKDIQDFNILDSCKHFCSMTEQEDDTLSK